MKAYSLLLGICSVAGVAVAQESASTPKTEVGFNYSYVHLTTAQSADFNQNGGSGYLEYNLNRVVGFVTDFGGYYNRNVVTDGNTSATFTYLFGPRFNWRKSRVVPYSQFLFGGADAGLNGSLAATGTNGFATAAGDGIDIAVKPIQVEYVTAQLPDVVSNRNSFQNNLRYSAGVVSRLGKK